jgi:glycosyltransferase involved in cell wall biosynthesis
MRILMVNTIDQGGGAERVATDLRHGLRARGLNVRTAVGRKLASDPDVFALRERALNPWHGLALAIERGMAPFAGRMPGPQYVLMATHWFGLPKRFRDWRAGRECFVYPASDTLMATAPREYDLIHAHNLHGDYFNLAALARASLAMPVVITLHDEWLMTGHCAYTLGCERWRAQCGACPHLDVYPALRRDGTRENLARKRDIYGAMRAVVVAPSQWLLDRAHASVLSPGMVDGQVIPNAVNLEQFSPGDRAESRRRLGWPEDARIFMFASSGGASNRYKDPQTVRNAVGRIATGGTKRSKTLFVFLGGMEPSVERENHREESIRIFGNPSRIADLYRAADIYLHAAHSENFPISILEALACGCPVIATAVGGIPEQYRTLDLPMARSSRADPSLPPAGVLTPPHDPEAMAQAALAILEEPELVACLAAGARATAERIYGLERQTALYAELYRSVIARSGTRGRQAQAECEA